MNQWTFISDALKRLNNEHTTFTNAVAIEVGRVESFFNEIRKIEQQEALGPGPSEVWQSYKAAVVKAASSYRMQLIRATTDHALALDYEKKAAADLLRAQLAGDQKLPRDGREGRDGR